MTNISAVEMREFDVHWRDGTVQRIEGSNIIDAFYRTGREGNILDAIDYYSPVGEHIQGVSMFTADDEEVLIVFKILCQKYPNENATELWETAGGKTSRIPYAPDAALLFEPDDTTGAFDDSIIGSLP